MTAPVTATGHFGGRSPFAGLDLCRAIEIAVAPGTAGPHFDQDVWDFNSATGLAAYLASSHKRWNLAAIRNPQWRIVAVARGSRAETVAMLHRLAAGLQTRCEVDGDNTRVWLTEPTTTYPRLEEFFTAAPDCVTPKQRAGFEARWHGHAEDRLLALEHAADTVVQIRGAA